MSLSSFCRFRSGSCFGALGFLALSWGVAAATPVNFTGEDLGAGPGSPHPSSSAAATAFGLASAALGVVSTITFESAPVGAFTTLTVAPGVTLSGANYNGGHQTILNSPAFPVAPSLDGFNTTPGGSNFAEMVGGSLTFSFTNPVDSFGAFLSGVQTYFYQDTITYSDGTTQVINVPGTGTSNSVGALDFVGFTDAGKKISGVTIYSGNASSGADFIGVDDVQYGVATPAATPEPESLMLVLTGLGGVGAAYRRFGRRSEAA